MSASIVEKDTSGVEDNGEVGSSEEIGADESPSHPVDWKNLLKPDYSGSGGGARKRVFALSASKNKSTYRKVEEAVSVIGSRDAGASVPAILTWIINNYPILDPTKLKVNVKRAVLKGLKGGRLVRTKTSKKAQGVAGSFTFPAQRIKLKAVRLEGKKYVFPILQPVSSNLSAVESPADVVKKSVFMDEGKMSSPKRQSLTPRRLPKSKLVPSEVPDLSSVEAPTDVMKIRASVDEGNMSSPKRQSSTPRRLPKSKLVPSEVPDLNVTIL